MISTQAFALFSLVAALVAFGFGYLLVEASTGHHRALSAPVKLALAVPALVAWALVVMLLHILTGGLVLSRPWVVRGLTVGAAAVAAVWLRRRGSRDEKDRDREPFSRRDALLIASVAILALGLWWVPVADMLPMHFSPDTNLHMGWAAQLMSGETTPSAVVTGDVPNYYPWLYHAVVSLLSSFMPGGRTYHALNPLQALLVVGTALALLAVGREMTSRMSTGVAAALFGALSGAFGIGLVFDTDVVDRIPDLRAVQIPWLGEILSRRPYNFGFNNLAPPYPRDISFLLLAVVLLMLVIGLRHRRRGALVGAGAALGMTGLVGGEAFIVGGGIALLACLATPESGHLKRLLYVAVPALCVYALWFAPLLVNYIRLDGFVNTTHVGPVVLAPSFFLLSWGLALPFALLGGLRLVVRFLSDAGARVVLSVMVVTAALMLSDAIPGLFGDAFLTLGRDHRYWSLFHLGVALVAAVGATEVWERAQRWKPVAGLLALVFVILACASPLYGSFLYRRFEPENSLLRRSLEGEDTVLNAIAPTANQRCVAAVPEGLGRLTFSYTGYRLVLWIVGHGRTNWARVRWTNLVDEVSQDQVRLSDNRELTQGQGTHEAWMKLAGKYGVDFVVTPTHLAESAAFGDLPQMSFTDDERSLTLITIKQCGDPSSSD